MNAIRRVKNYGGRRYWLGGQSLIGIGDMLSNGASITTTKEKGLVMEPSLCMKYLLEQERKHLLVEFHIIY